MRVALMGGGTAGHLFPSVAVAQRLVTQHDAEVLFVSAAGKLDSSILDHLGLRHESILARPFPYGLSLRLISALWSLYCSYRRCCGILRRFRPQVVFGAGGYVSVAGVLAAARMGVPVVCHVSDAYPDRANRAVARFATRITTHYEAAAAAFPPEKTTVTGQPVRQEFAGVTRERARAALGLPHEAFVLLVMGGSQGARTLNHAVLGALPELLAPSQVHVIHITGALDHDAIAARAREAVGANPRYRCMAFHDQPWLLCGAADLALTRGGASSLAEMAVVGLPMIIAPYPYAAAHQEANAAPLAEAGAAIVVRDVDLTPEWLVAQVTELRERPSRLCAMAEATRRISRPQAAQIIASLIVQLADQGRRLR